MTKTKYISQGLIKTFIILLSFIGTQKAVLSQKPQHTEEITIIGSYKPSIQDAYKINSNPEINLEEQKMPKLSYSITSAKVKTSTKPEALDHERRLKDPKQNLFGNYVKLGFGNYKTPYLDFYANTLQSKKYSLGVHLKHLSSLGEIKNRPFSTFSNNIANISAKRFFKNHTLSAEAFYKYDIIHFYNLTQNIFDSLEMNEDAIRQRFQRAGANIGLNSNYDDDGKLNHSFNFKYYYITDYYGTSEKKHKLSTDVNIDFELFGSDKLQNLGIFAEINHYSNDDSINIKTKNITARLQPYFKAAFGKYKLYFKLNAVSKLDSVNKIKLFPLVKGEVEVIPGELTAFIGTNGDFFRNSFNSFYKENPFISSIIPLEYSKNRFEVYGGIMGNIENAVNYSIMISSKNIENMPFFVNDTSINLLDKFTVSYDTVDIIHFKGEFSYQSNENLRIILRADYYSFNLKNELEAWYRPQFESSIDVYAKFIDKITLKASLAAHSKMYSKTYESLSDQIIPREIDPWMDLSFGADYKFSERFSAFVDLNNVMNSQYKKWDNYPLQKFNFIGGITFSF